MVRSSPETIVSPPPTQATAPATTSESKVANPQDFQIEILNGNGIAGDANRVKTILGDQGFVVANIGNAINSNFVTTEINAKESVPRQLIFTT